jgi:hypothetical protein
MTTFLLISAIATWGVLIFNILLLMGLIKRVNQLGGKPTKEFLLEEAKRHRGEAAALFTAETPNGETVTLDSFAGQDVAFLFLSPTCQPLLCYVHTSLLPD